MKKNVLFLSALAVMLSFSGCDEKTKLANNIQGTWEASPEKLTTPSDIASANMIKIFDITTVPGKSEGTIDVTGLVSFVSPVPSGSDVLQNVSVSTSGIISAKGTWNAIDDDEIMVFVDPKSLEVTVDTAAVELKYDILTTQDLSELTSLKPAVAEHVKHQIMIVAGSKITGINKIDDIKIKDNMMSCEIGKQDMTFRRQVAK